MLNEFGNFVPYLQSLPIEVEPFSKSTIVEIAAGYSFNTAITEDGNVYTWGFNEKVKKKPKKRKNGTAY